MVDLGRVRTNDSPLQRIPTTFSKERHDLRVAALDLHIKGRMLL